MLLGAARDSYTCLTLSASEKVKIVVVELSSNVVQDLMVVRKPL